MIRNEDASARELSAMRSARSGRFDEAKRSGMPLWASRLTLVLTFVIGPFGLCVFVLLRRLTATSFKT